MNKSVQRIDPQDQAVTAMSESATILSVIQRAAADPQCDIEKMERLMAMHERMQDRQAEAAFNAAMSAMQSDLPSIVENGKGHNNAKYALLEDINDVIKPILQTHGFAVSYKVEHHQGGINVTGILMHAAGHREETTMLLPNDTSGSKNAVQAVGSAVSYGRRYVICALLNITTRGADDDGYAAGPTAPRITAVQAASLQALLDKCSEGTRVKFGELYGSLDQITKPNFDTVCAQLKKAVARDTASQEQQHANHS